MKPVLQALVLADRVYRDAVSGKRIIAGTFTSFWFSKTPAHKEVTQPDGTKRRLLAGGLQAGSPWAYLSLTDVVDGTKLLLQFVNVGTQKQLFSTEVELKCTDRLATVEVELALPMLPIDAKGVYAFEVLCDGELLGSYRIHAVEMTVA
ncbi:MAG: hypothetical protein WCJ35_00980 [Planctomycetota bacterium]